jgi:hypothetical protein
MSHFWRLYTQEMRNLGVRYLIFLIAYFAINGIVYFAHIDKRILNITLTSSIMLVIIFITPPILLALSFRKDKEHLSFSLPIRRASIFLSRYLAALTMLVAAFFAAALWSIFVMVPLNLHQREQMCINIGHADFFRMIPYYNDFWGFLLNESHYFLYTIYLFFFLFIGLGIISLTRSLRYMFRRFSEFLCDLSALILFIVCWIGLNHLNPMGIVPESLMFFSLIAGLLFLAIGLFLFEKYGEL